MKDWKEISKHVFEKSIWKKLYESALFLLISLAIYIIKPGSEFFCGAEVFNRVCDYVPCKKKKNICGLSWVGVK